MTRYTCNNFQANNGCGRVHADYSSALACCARNQDAARMPVDNIERSEVEDDACGNHRSWLFETWTSDIDRCMRQYAYRFMFVEAHPPVSCNSPNLRQWSMLHALARNGTRNTLLQVVKDLQRRLDQGMIGSKRAQDKVRRWLKIVNAAITLGEEFWRQRQMCALTNFTGVELAAVRLREMVGTLPANRKRIPTNSPKILPFGYKAEKHGGPDDPGTIDYEDIDKRWLAMCEYWLECARNVRNLDRDWRAGDPMPERKQPDPEPEPAPDPAPAPAAPALGDVARQVAVGDVAQQIAQLLTSGGGVNKDEVRAIAEQSARDAIAAAASEGTLTMRIKVTRPDMSEWEIPDDEALHDKFQDCVGWLRLGVPVFLRGPAGTGKSMLGRQLAAAFDRPFASMSLSGGTAEYHFTGSRLPDADGAFRHRTTPFLEMFENGGVMLLDEVDACDENVLLAINDGIANGLLPVPGRDDAPFARKHEDFMLICAANTWGTGPSAVYVGRNQLDGAFLNRFGLVEVDYDPKLERALCPNMPELVTKWQRLRDEVRKAQLRRIISMRELQRLYLRTQADGWTVARCLQEAVLAWTPDEIKSCKTVAEVVS